MRVGVTVVLLHAGHAAPRRPLHVVGHLRQTLEGLLAPDAGEDVPRLLTGPIDPLRLPGVLPPTARLGAHRLRGRRRRAVVVQVVVVVVDAAVRSLALIPRRAKGWRRRRGCGGGRSRCSCNGILCQLSIPLVQIGKLRLKERGGCRWVVVGVVVVVGITGD